MYGISLFLEAHKQFNSLEYCYLLVLFVFLGLKFQLETFPTVFFGYYRY